MLRYGIRIVIIFNMLLFSLYDTKVMKKTDKEVGLDYFSKKNITHNPFGSWVMLIGSYFREMPLCHLFDSLVSTLTFVAAAQCHVGNRSSNEDR